MIRRRWNNYVYLLLLLAVAPLCASAAAAQASPSVPTLTIRPSAQAAAVPVPIASGDLLNITVYDSPELTQKVRVEADGDSATGTDWSYQGGWPHRATSRCN